MILCRIAPLFMRVVMAIKREARITWRMIRHNASFAFVPPWFLLAGGLCASFARAGALSPLPCLGVASKLLVFFFFYAYVFDIANQVLAAEEDALNKPSRPIPSGLMTIRGGILRWIVSWALFPIV